MNKCEFLEPEAMYSIMAWRFLFDILFSVVFNKSMCISVLGPPSCPSSSLVILIIHSEFRYAFWLPYFCSKSFGFFYIRLLVFFRATPSQLLIEFYFVVLKCPVLSLLLYTWLISL